MSTPTPRTDDIAGSLIDAEEVVPADFARKLERELTAERARLDWLLSYDGVDWILSAHKNRKLFEGESDNRALLEAAMKEDAQ